MRSFLPIAAIALAAVALTPRTADAACSIVCTADKAGQFKTLDAALKAAGLASTLRGRGHYTVFAPTDAAFARLPAGTVQTLLQPRNRGKLRTVLLYHVLGKRVGAAAIPRGRSSAKTLAGPSLHLRKRGGGVHVNDARVVKADIAASNGVIHVVDKVLIPR
jgi:uncharacterized surface protein with fasciclin (FAS1) repeats